MRKIKGKLRKPEVIFIPKRVPGTLAVHLAKKMASYVLKFGICSPKA